MVGRECDLKASLVFISVIRVFTLNTSILASVFFTGKPLLENFQLAWKLQLTDLA